MAEIGALGGATLDTGNLKRSASIAEGVFGVLYTLSKDKAGPTKAQTVLIIALDILQLLVFVLNDRFPWGTAVTEFLSQLRNLQLQNPLSELGYPAYLVAFWLLTAILLLCLAICVYVAASFREGKFSLVWPIIFVRKVVSVLFTTFFTSSLNVFLQSFDCKFVGQERPMLIPFGTTKDAAGTIISYSIPCWTMPHAVTSVSGVVMAVVFFTFALIISLVDFEPNLRSTNPMASADSRAEAIFFVAKTSLAVSSALISSYPLAIAIIFSCASTAMTLTMLWLLPYREAWVNRLRCAGFASLAFSSYVLVAVVLVNNPSSNVLVLLEAFGIAPAFGVGWLLMMLRERFIDGRYLLRNPRTAAIIRDPRPRTAAGPGRFLAAPPGAGAGAAPGAAGSSTEGAGAGAGAVAGASSGAAGGPRISSEEDASSAGENVHAHMLSGAAALASHSRDRAAQRRRAMIRALLRAGCCLPSETDGALGASPFRAPDQVERSTRFVGKVERRFRMLDDIFAETARVFGQQRAATMSAAAVASSAVAAAAAGGGSSGNAPAGASAAGSTALALAVRRGSDAATAPGAGASALTVDVGAGAGAGTTQAAPLNATAAVPFPRSGGSSCWRRFMRCLTCRCCPCFRSGSAASGSSDGSDGGNGSGFGPDGVSSFGGPGAGNGALSPLSSVAVAAMSSADAASLQRAVQERMLRALHEADALYRHGLAVFPESASLHLAYASYLLAYGGRDSEGLAKFHIDRARRLNTSFQDRFLIFLRDTERKHQVQGEAVGEANMDLVSYVEFSNAMEAAITTHRAMLKAMRRFWRMVGIAAAEANAAARSRAASRAARDTSGAAGTAGGDKSTAAAGGAAGGAAGAGGAAAGGAGAGDASGLMSMIAAQASKRSFSGGASVRSFGSMRSHSTFSAGDDAWDMDGVGDGASSFGGSGLDGQSDTGSSSKHSGWGGFFGSGSPASTESSNVLGTKSGRGQGSSGGGSSGGGAGGGAGSASGSGGGRDRGGGSGGDLQLPPGMAAALSSAFTRIDSLEQKVKAIYSLLIEKYPRSAKLLRAYAQFSADVLDDRKKAARLTAEALRLEEAQKDAMRFAGKGKGTGLGGPAGMGALAGGDGSGAEGLIVINDAGIITTVSKVGAKMFGYSPAELQGRNVSCLMGPPHSLHHNTYIANYLSTGISHIIGTRRPVEARHKDGSMLPVELQVNQVDNPTGILFAAVVHRLPDDSLTARIVINKQGIIQQVNKRLLDLFGYAQPSDLLHQNIKMLMPQKYAVNHDGYLRAAAEGRGKGVLGISGRRLEGLHRSGMSFPISLEIKERGSGDSGVYEGVITELTHEYGMITISQSGSILSVNTGAQAIFGYKDQNALLSKNVNMLMPEPYRSFHDGFLLRYLTTGVASILNKSRYVSAEHADGSVFPVTIEVTELKRDAQGGGAGGAAGAGAGAGGKAGGILTSGAAGKAGGAARRNSGVTGADKGGKDEKAGDKGGKDDKHHKDKHAHGSGKRVFVAKITLADVMDDMDSSDIAGSYGKLKTNDPVHGYVRIDKKGIITHCNAQFARIFRYPDAAHMLGRNIKIIVPADIEAEHDSYLDRYANTRMPNIIGSAGRQLFGRRSDGKMIALSLRVQEYSSKADASVYHPPREMASVRTAPTTSAADKLAAEAAGSPSAGGGSTGAGAGAGGGGGFSSPPPPPAMPAGHPRVPAGAGIGGCPVLRSAVTIDAQTLSSRFGLSADALGPGGGAAGPAGSGLLRAESAGGAAFGQTRSAAAGASSGNLRMHTAASSGSLLRMPGQGAPPGATAIDVGAEAQAVVTEDGGAGMGSGFGSGSGSGPASGASGDASGVPLAGPGEGGSWFEGQRVASEWDGYEAWVYALEDLEILVTINAAGTITDVNSAACSCFGYYAEELVGQNIKMLMPPEIAEAHDGFLASYKATNTKKLIGSRRVVTAQHRDGNPLRLVVEVAEQLVRHGSAAGVPGAWDHLPPLERPLLMPDRAGGSSFIETFFRGRMILATQSRTDLEMQAKDTMKRLVRGARKASHDRKRTRGGTSGERNKTASAKAATAAHAAQATSAAVALIESRTAAKIAARDRDAGKGSGSDSAAGSGGARSAARPPRKASVAGSASGDSGAEDGGNAPANAASGAGAGSATSASAAVGAGVADIGKPPRHSPPAKSSGDEKEGGSGSGKRSARNSLDSSGSGGGAAGGASARRGVRFHSETTGGDGAGSGSGAGSDGGAEAAPVPRSSPPRTASAADADANADADAGSSASGPGSDAAAFTGLALASGSIGSDDPDAEGAGVAAVHATGLAAKIAAAGASGARGRRGSPPTRADATERSNTETTASTADDLDDSQEGEASATPRGGSGGARGQGPAARFTSAAAAAAAAAPPDAAASPAARHRARERDRGDDRSDNGSEASSHKSGGDSQSTHDDDNQSEHSSHSGTGSETTDFSLGASDLSGVLARLRGDASSGDGASTHTGDDDSAVTGEDADKSSRHSGGRDSRGGKGPSGGVGTGVADSGPSAQMRRARERQLKRMSRHQRIASTAARLYTAAAWVSFFIAAVVVVPYGVLMALLAQHRDLVRQVQATSVAAVLTSALSTDARRLQLAAAQTAAAVGFAPPAIGAALGWNASAAVLSGAYSTLWYSPSPTLNISAAGAHESAVTFALVRNRLSSNADVFEHLQRSLISGDTTAADSVGALAMTDSSRTSMFYSLQDVALRWVASTPSPYTILVRTNLWTMGKAAMMAAESLADRAAGLATVGNAPLTPQTLSSPASLIINEAIAMQAPNGSASYLHAVPWSAQVETSLAGLSPVESQGVRSTLWFADAPAAAAAAQGIPTPLPSAVVGSLLPAPPVPTGSSSAWALVPSAALESPAGSSAFQFLIANGPGVLQSAAVACVRAASLDANSREEAISTVQIVVFVLQLITPTVLLSLLIRPLLLRVAEERLAMFRVFVRLPTEALYKLSRVSVTVGDAAAEEDSSDEDDGDGGEGGGGGGGGSSGSSGGTGTTSADLAAKLRQATLARTRMQAAAAGVPAPAPAPAAASAAAGSSADAAGAGTVTVDVSALRVALPISPSTPAGAGAGARMPFAAAGSATPGATVNPFASGIGLTPSAAARGLGGASGDVYLARLGSAFSSAHTVASLSSPGGPLGHPSAGVVAGGSAAGRQGAHAHPYSAGAMSGSSSDGHARGPAQGQGQGNRRGRTGGLFRSVVRTLGLMGGASGQGQGQGRNAAASAARRQASARRAARRSGRVGPAPAAPPFVLSLASQRDVSGAAAAAGSGAGAGAGAPRSLANSRDPSTASMASVGGPGGPPAGAVAIAGSSGAGAIGVQDSRLTFERGGSDVHLYAGDAGELVDDWHEHEHDDEDEYDDENWEEDRDRRGCCAGCCNACAATCLTCFLCCSAMVRCARSCGGMCSRRLRGVRRFLQALGRLPPVILTVLSLMMALIVAFFLAGFILSSKSAAAVDCVYAAGLQAMLAARTRQFAQELVIAASALAYNVSSTANVQPSVLGFDSRFAALLAPQSLAPAVAVAGTTLAASFQLSAAETFTSLAAAAAAGIPPPTYTSATFGYTGAALSAPAASPATLLLGAASQRSLSDYVTYARSGLRDAAAQLLRYQHALVSGDVSMGIEPGSCLSTTQSSLLFTSGCLRTTGNCVPSGHPYAGITTSGLHSLVRYYADTATFLANESIAALSAGAMTPGSTPTGASAVATTSRIPSGLPNLRLEFIWAVSEGDLADGLATSLKDYADAALSLDNAASTAYSVIMSVFVVVVIVTYFALFRPYISRISAEFNRATALLRTLPDDVDLEALQPQASDSSHSNSRKAAAAAAAVGGKGSNGSVTGDADKSSVASGGTNTGSQTGKPLNSRGSVS